MRALLVSLLCAAVSAAPPNVVFILCDDLGVSDLGCYDRHDHKTPNLDRLAAEGMRFATAYAACPVCSPTRAAILTGKNPARLHLTTFLPGRGDKPSQKLLHPKIVPALPLEEVTLAERLKSAGYATACIGKWHLGHSPKEQGFDYVHAGKANTQPSAIEGGKGEYDLTDKAIEFITANKDKPFFLYLSHNAPHIGLAAQRDLIEKYRNAFNPTYAAIIHTIDDSVGLILSTLARQELDKNTLVIFTSDNGGLHVPELKDDAPTHNFPCRAGKGFLYEGGLRVPLIARGPNVPAGSECREPVISTDWTPTLASLCGATTKDAFDGLDLTGLLHGKIKDLPRTLTWHFPHYTNQGSRPGGAIRSGTFKLIENYEDGKLELYNLGTDAGERQNLAGQLVGITQGLQEKLTAWRKSVGAQDNMLNPQFDPALHKSLYLDVNVSDLPFETTAKKLSDPLREWRKKMDAPAK